MTVLFLINLHLFAYVRSVICVYMTHKFKLVKIRECLKCSLRIR